MDLSQWVLIGFDLSKPITTVTVERPWRNRHDSLSWPSSVRARARVRGRADVI